MTDITQIYGLMDPITNELRYVGKTQNSVEGRLKSHCSPKELNLHKRNWIQKLLRSGHTPEIVVLETVKDNGDEAEVFWIAYMKFLGCRLSNITSGGDGRPHSNETKLKIFRAQKGRPESAEHKAKISVTKRQYYANGGISPTKGIPRTEEQKRKQSLAMTGRKNGPHSEETRRKIAASKLGKPRSPETRAKLSAALKGRKMGPRPPEVGKKISEAKLASFAARRAKSGTCFSGGAKENIRVGNYKRRGKAAWNKGLSGYKICEGQVQWN